MKKTWLGILAAVLIISIAANLTLLGRCRAVSKIQKQQSITLENSYQRSFLELSDDVEQIKQQLAQVLVSASREQTILGLANLWRAVYGALNTLNSLPIALEELDNTNAFLRDAAEYSYFLIRTKVFAEEKMAAGEWSKLEEFYQRVQVVQQELSRIEAQVLNESLKFSDLAEAAEDNAILSAFRGIESRIGTFPVIELEEGVRKIEPEPRPIAGDKISADEALRLAQEFYSAFFDGNYTAKLEFTSEESKIPIYGVRLYGVNDEEPVYVEVSQNGGHILQMYQYRPIGNSVLDIAAAEHAGEEFLRQMGFKEMALVDDISDCSSCDLTFVPAEDGVYIYSDMIKLMVALDTGEILSFDQTGYITRHYKRELPAPKLSEAEIRRGMNPNLKIESVRLALLTDEYSENEYLTYEVRGEVVGEKFAVFVDAQNGLERRIVRLSKDEQYQFKTGE